MKRALWIVPVLLLAAGATWLATREPEMQGIVVVVGTLQADGPVPRPLYAQSLDDETDQRRYELLPVPDKPNTFHAPGTVVGHYDFYNEDGWRFINRGGRALPLFDPEKGAIPIAMGRPYCAYVRAVPGSGFELESIVTVEHIEGERRTGLTYRPVEGAEIVEHVEGWVSVRLPPEVCVREARFRLTGWLSGRHPFDPITVSIGPQPRRPYLTAARAASVGRLRVMLVGSGEVPDDVEVHASLRGLPLKMTDKATTSGGQATFPSLGAFPEGLLLRVPAWGPGADYALGIDQWRREGTVFLRVPEDDALWVTLDVPDGVSVDNVAVLDATTDRFALAQLDRESPAPRVRTRPGPQTWIVYAGAQSVAFDVTPQDGRVTLPALQDSVRVLGRLGGGNVSYRVRFLREVGDRWVGGTGMEVDARVGSRYEAQLPAGRYRIHVVKPGGRLTKPLTLDWEPGTNVELPLDAK